MKELLQSRPEILITVVGIGGCGCNTVNMLHESNFADSVNLIAVNTDLAVLNHTDVESKILIGEDLTNGYGAGADPAVGLKAAGAYYLGYRYQYDSHAIYLWCFS